MHPYAEIIKAWAEGKAIQTHNITVGWVDLHPTDYYWTEHPNRTYRIKPEVIKYRLAKIGRITPRILSYATYEYAAVETLDIFQGWIGPEMEYTSQ